MSAPLSRLMDEQPVFVEEPSVGGRSEPRRDREPDGFTHDLRFNGAVGGIGISAYCQPCHQGIWIDDGHSLTDLVRLAAMHSNPADVTIEVTAVLAEMAAQMLAEARP